MQTISAEAIGVCLACLPCSLRPRFPFLPGALTVVIIRALLSLALDDIVCWMSNNILLDEPRGFTRGITSPAGNSRSIFLT